MFKGSVREKWKGVRFAINIVIIPIFWKPEPTCIYIYIYYTVLSVSLIFICTLHLNIVS